MKKTLIIALLVALVLGVFTACNGDVFADLVDKKEEANIILELDQNHWTFDEEEKEEIVVSIPSGCTKWVDMVGEKITVYYYHIPFELTFGADKGNACYIYTSGDEYIYAYLTEPFKSIINYISINSDITPGETYRLCIDWKLNFQ